MKKNLSLLLASLVIAGAVTLTVPFLHAQPANNPTPKPPVMEATPAMHAALKDLQHAREALIHARKAFGGHRVAALKAVDQAIVEVKEGIAYPEEKH